MRTPRILLFGLAVGCSVAALASSKIAYRRQDSVWKMRDDGTGKTRLTQPHTSNDSNPSISPSGTQVYFDGGSGGDLDIFVVDYDGSPVTNLTSDSSAHDWDPDAGSDGLQSYVLFLSDRDHAAGEIYRMNLDGSNVVRLTSNTSEDLDPAWCGTDEIVFARKNSSGYFDIWVRGLDPEDSETQLTSYSGDERHPDCHPNGRYVAYQRYFAGSYSEDIFEIDREDNNAETNLTGGLFGDHEYEQEPSYSPGGASIVFTWFYSAGSYWDIYTFDRGTSAIDDVATTSDAEFQPSWGELP